MNPSLLLGPGDVRGSSTEDVRLFLEGAVPAVPAGGLSFVDARDAAEAMVPRDGARARPGERYLVGACNLTVRDFFARLGADLGRARAVAADAALARAGARRRARRSSASPRAWACPAGRPVSVEMAQCFWYLDSSEGRARARLDAARPGRHAPRHGRGPARARRRVACLVRLACRGRSHSQRLARGEIALVIRLGDPEGSV